MADLHLIIGNKNYSSWSLRPWLLMKHLGLPFRETVVPLDQPQFKSAVAQYGPSGRVPVLVHAGLSVWDSLAICEYVFELTGKGWPQERAARAVARSVCAEMHSGFTALRSTWPMNARARDRRTPMSTALQADIARVEELWNDCVRRFGNRGGPWLFGEFSIADAMYAPVVLRFNTYGAQLSQSSQRYVDTVLQDGALVQWMRAAQDETWAYPSSEVGQLARE